MILKDSLLDVGKIGKTHGVKGELVCQFTNDGFDIEELGFVVLEMDGIMVPFFLDECKTKGADSLILKFDGIADEQRAKQMVGKTIYVPKDAIDEDGGFDVTHLVGWALEDKNRGLVGVIDGIDDSTANLLFLVGEVLIPVSEEWIIEIDEKGQRLIMDLPEGLLDL